MTGASDNSQPAASSVLVVVQGPWYAIAGLAEDFSVAITKSSADQIPQLQEAGADPIRFAGSSSTLPTTFPEDGSLYVPSADNRLHVHGPVGHTFDTSDANPLWVTSSFVLDPPPSERGTAQEGTFARVQFTRLLNKDGILQSDTQPGAKYPTLVPSKDFASDPTDPVWIQFLASRFLPRTSHTDSFDHLVVSVDNSLINPQPTLSIRDSNDPNRAILQLTYPLNPGYADSSLPIFGLLLTQLVPDLIGRKGQERFIDLLLQSASSSSTSAVWPFPKSNGIDPTAIIGRIVVIQRQVNTSAACDRPAPATSPTCNLISAAELWKELFPAFTSTDPSIFPDAVDRIVAVSPPIPDRAPLDCSVDSGAGGD